MKLSDFTPSELIVVGSFMRAHVKRVGGWRGLAAAKPLNLTNSILDKIESNTDSELTYDEIAHIRCEAVSEIYKAEKLNLMVKPLRLAKCKAIKDKIPLEIERAK